MFFFSLLLLLLLLLFFFFASFFFSSCQGGLVPGHVLIVPVSHQQRYSELTKEGITEAERYKESFSRCLYIYNITTVTINRILIDRIFDQLTDLFDRLTYGIERTNRPN